MQSNQQIWRFLTVVLRLALEDAVQLTTGQHQSMADIATRSHHHQIQAAAGIGQPARFFEMLKDAGAVSNARIGSKT